MFILFLCCMGLFVCAFVCLFVCVCLCVFWTAFLALYRLPDVSPERQNGVLGLCVFILVAVERSCGGNLAVNSFRVVCVWGGVGS